MRFGEMAQRWLAQAGAVEQLTGAPERSAQAAPHEGDLHWRPTPDAQGALLQDPDFSLPTAAGPLKWSLYHHSQESTADTEWGWGRRASFPLKLISDGTVVTVSHEDGTTRQYRKDGTTDRFYGVGANYDVLQQNGDGSWEETLWDTGLKFHFPSGSAVSAAYRETPQGLRLTYGYDGSQRLQYVEEPTGRRVTLGYDANSRVEYVQDWGDRRNTLTYDGNGDLVEVEGPTGCITLYEYDAAHRLTGITDPEGFETTYTYDGLGRVASRSVAGNLGRYTYQTDASGVLTMTYADPLGRTWTHTSGPRGNPLRDIDPLGNIATYAYQNYRLLSSLNSLGQETTYAYDGNGFLRAVRDPLGHRTTYGRDQYGNVDRAGRRARLPHQLALRSRWPPGGAGERFRLPDHQRL